MGRAVVTVQPKVTFPPTTAAGGAEKSVAVPATMLAMVAIWPPSAAVAGADAKVLSITAKIGAGVCP